jgi:hemerythrin superfamily protein
MQAEMEKEQEEVGKNATIYDLLKLEHKDVKKLFKQILDAERYQENIYSQIKMALTLHMEGEEKLFYPKLENNQESRLLTLEAYEEHDVAKKVINDIDMTGASDKDTRLAKVKVLSEAINHHIEEEERDLFKNAKKVLSSEQEREIARQFMNEKMAKMPKM